MVGVLSLKCVLSTSKSLLLNGFSLFMTFMGLKFCADFV
jgi:hypothetical protein